MMLLAEACSWGTNHPTLQQQRHWRCRCYPWRIRWQVFYLFGMKEPNYVMQIMSMYGTLQKKGPEKKRHYEVDGQKEVKMFVYPEVVHNHYAYRDMIDNHNSQQMHPISIEETWMTTRWPNRVFGFLLAIMVVKVQNAGVYFC